MILPRETLSAAYSLMKFLPVWMRVLDLVDGMGFDKKNTIANTEVIDYTQRKKS